MGRRKETASGYKEKVYMQVRKYMAKSDEMQNNTGQLHFLKGLFISNLSVASPIHVKKPENILEHLDRTIFNKSSAEICSMFDSQSNLEAFIHSPYFEDMPEYLDFVADKNGEVLPFLLIQQAQAEIEKALRYYVSFEDKETNALEKNKVFLELLYSTALYEIFLKEFEERLRQEPGYAEITLKLNQIEDVLQSGAFGEAEKDVYACIKAVEHGWTFLFYAYCVMYYVKHMINLFAVFRILMFVECVSLNGVREYGQKASKIFSEEAKSWENQVREWKKKDLFLPLRNNKNLHVLHDELNRICLKYRLYPHLEEKSRARTFQYEVDGFRKEFMQYIEAIEACQKFSAAHRPKEKEKQLWDAAEQMSLPVISAMEEILTIQENAKEQKAKNAEKSWKRRQQNNRAKRYHENNGNNL